MLILLIDDGPALSCYVLNSYQAWDFRTLGEPVDLGSWNSHQAMVEIGCISDRINVTLPGLSFPARLNTAACFDSYFISGLELNLLQASYRLSHLGVVDLPNIQARAA